MTERVLSIAALVGVVGILVILGFGRIREAEDDAAAARAKVAWVQDHKRDLQEAVRLLIREVERLRLLVFSFGGDPGVFSSGTPGGNPNVGKDGGKPKPGPKPSPKPSPPPPEPEPSPTICVPMTDVCV